MFDFKELRYEFSSKTFRDNLKSVVGITCANCGSDNTVEYHHIVPLSLGGTNKFTNIVPLCSVCHDKAHADHKDLKHDGIRRSKMNGVKFGRKSPMSYDDALPIMKRYFNCEIWAFECKTLLGYGAKQN